MNATGVRVAGDPNDNDGNTPIDDGATLSDAQIGNIREKLAVLAPSGDQDAREHTILEWCAMKGFGATELSNLPASKFEMIEKQLDYWIKKRGGDNG